MDTFPNANLLYKYKPADIPPEPLMKTTLYIKEWVGEFMFFGLTWQTDHAPSWFQQKMIKWAFGITYTKHEGK